MPGKSKKPNKATRKAGPPVPATQTGAQAGAGRPKKNRPAALDRAEADHRESLSILDGIDEMVYVVDPKTYEVLFANQALRKVVADAVGRKCHQAFQGLDAPCSFCTNDRIFGENEGKTYVWECQNRRNQRWYRCIDKAIRWPDGRMVRYETARDITDRKLADDAFRAAREELVRSLKERTAEVTEANVRLRAEIAERKRADEARLVRDSALASAISGIALADALGKITYVNHSFLRMWGYQRPEEVMGKNTVDFWESPLLAGQVVRSIQDGGIWIGELTAKRKDGSLFDAQLSANTVRDETGKIVCMMSSFIDTTEQNRTEDELEGLLRLYQSTVETMPSALIALDDQLNVVLANSLFLDSQRLHPGDVIGRNIADVLPPAVLAEEALLDHVRAAAEGGGTDQVLGLRQSLRGGPDRFLNVRICGIQSTRKRENQPRVLVVISDVTEQRRLLDQLNQAAKMESIGRLAGGVAHDFNNILTGITGHTHMLLAQLRADEAAQRKLTRIRELAERAARLTLQLLAFAQRQPMQPVVLNLNQLVENLSAMLRHVIGEDIALDIRLAPDLGNVRADPTQIEQVLMNLVVNARDAMPDGGKLAIETAEVSDRASRRADAPPDHVMLAVRDGGCGMSAETLSHLFEPFFTTKGVGKGTGLGLATAYGIVQQHRGRIEVQSTPGEGTTFRIFLPRVEDQAEALAAAAAARASKGGSESLLIVEDEKEVRDVAAAILAEKGYRVLTAASPAEAEELMKRPGHGIALLVTDVVLPECSGPDLYEKLLASHPALKVLYISGYLQRAADLTRPELAPLLRKPFTPEQLAARVREVLDEEAPQPDA